MADQSNKSELGSRSCSFFGEMITVEEALRRTVAESQDTLNQVDLALRQLVAGELRIFDSELEEFAFAVDLDDRINDLIDGFCENLEEISDISAEIRGEPETKESKAWYKEHKAKRKEAKKAEAEKKKAEIAAAKEREKALQIGPK